MVHIRGLRRTDEQRGPAEVEQAGARERGPDAAVERGGGPAAQLRPEEPPEVLKRRVGRRDLPPPHVQPRPEREIHRVGPAFASWPRSLTGHPH
jgi:hypothetical protein